MYLNFKCTNETEKTAFLIEILDTTNAMSEAICSPDQNS